MRFQSLYTEQEFKQNLPEQIMAYNTTRELRHLRLKSTVAQDGSITIREGRRNKIIGACEFNGHVVVEKGQNQLVGQVTRSPKITPRGVTMFVLHNLAVLLLFTIAPYLVCLALARLFETDNRIIAIIVPTFMAFCIIYGFVRDWFFTKRRITRFLVSQMHCVAVEDAPVAVRKKQRQVPFLRYLRHLCIWYFFFVPVKIFCRLLLRFKATKRSVHPKRNFVMIANHVTDYDMLFMALSMKKHMYFVMSEHALRKGFASRILRLAFAPIGRSKGSNAGSTVMTMLRYAKEGYNIGIFAEGFRTMDGKNTSFSPATGSLVRKMKVDLVTYRIRGGYYTNPNWSPHLRKGRVWGEFAGHYTADQLAKMTDAEVNELIARDIYEDADLTQAEHHITYHSKKGLAENIQYALLICPLCRRMGKMHSAGNTFWCDCGAKGVFTPECKLESEDFPYQTIGEWSRFQEEYVASMERPDDSQILIEAEGQNLIEVDDFYHEDKCLVENGIFTQTPVSFSVGDHTFFYRDIAYFDMVRQGQLVFTTKSGQYYHIKGEVQLPGVLAKMLYYRFSD